MQAAQLFSSSELLHREATDDNQVEICEHVALYGMPCLMGRLMHQKHSHRSHSAWPVLLCRENGMMVFGMGMRRSLREQLTHAYLLWP